VKTIVGINGAAGRMGQRLIHLVREDHALALGAALEAPQCPHLGRDVGELCGVGPIGVPLRADLQIGERLDVVIDFSAPEGTMAVLPLCVQRRIPLVVATTGHTAAQKAEIESAAHDTAVLVSPNMSVVVNVLFELVRTTSRLLAGKGFDVEIIERHHRFKKDSPSGTALHFARIIQEEMKLADVRHGRQGDVGERPATEIGMHAVRAGDNVGEHTVIFGALGETLELVHKSSSRDSYARGALLAARFLAGRPAGRYSMKDVLGL
jgi:4-hydroxy-tetrahydrodipicolinate reductase